VQNCPRYRYFLYGLLLVLIHMPSSWANQQSSLQQVRIAMGNFEPYFIEKGETGIFTDLVRAVFEEMPKYRPLYLFGYSNRRAWHDFEQGKLDAVSNLIDSEELDACRSDKVFRFRDVVVSKASSHYKIHKMSDLANKRIITFQGAKGFLGEEFSKTIKAQNYQEIAQQNWQAKVLFTDAADVSIGDMFTFLHSIKEMKKISARTSDFVFHDLFPPQYSRMGFHDVKLCKAFNKALKKVKDSGRYEQIYEQYLQRFNYYH